MQKDYSPFYTTWIYNIRIDPIKWLVLIKMFDIGTNVRCTTMETNVSYPTALYAFDCMRYAILKSRYAMNIKIRGKFELDEEYFGGKRKGNRGRGVKNKIIVFGILERKGSVRVKIVKNVNARTLLKKTIKKVKDSSAYANKWKGCDSLVFSGCQRLVIDHSKLFGKDKVHINGIEGFWSYAKQNLAKHHGMKPDKFPMYIKEMEWRYNNKDRFMLLLNYLCGG